MVIPIIIDIFVFLLCILVAKYTEWGATLRNYFDAKVLGLQEEEYTQDSEREIWERVNIVCKKHMRECETQIRNTGRDNPPGVKNWYEFSAKLDGNKALFACQYINCWYNRKHRPYRFGISVCLFLIITAAIIGLLRMFNVSFVDTLIYLAALAVKMFDRMYQNYRYLRVSLKMDAIISLPGVEDNREQINYLQTLINSRREIPVLEINALHKRLVKSWSELLEQITKNIIHK